jgi:hypothetical protein
MWRLRVAMIGGMSAPLDEQGSVPGQVQRPSAIPVNAFRDRPPAGAVPVGSVGQAPSVRLTSQNLQNSRVCALINEYRLVA